MYGKKSRCRLPELMDPPDLKLSGDIYVGAGHPDTLTKMLYNPKPKGAE
jgi:hypothetical protein